MSSSGLANSFSEYVPPKIWGVVRNCVTNTSDPESASKQMHLVELLKGLDAPLTGGLMDLPSQLTQAVIESTSRRLSAIVIWYTEDQSEKPPRCNYQEHPEDYRVHYRPPFLYIEPEGFLYFAQSQQDPLILTRFYQKLKKHKPESSRFFLKLQSM